MHNDLSRELADLARKQAKQLGLWDRIRMKKERGESPAKPGDKDYPDSKSWKKVTNLSKKPEKQAAKSPAWQREAGKNPEGGLNAKGRASYNKATGGNLKAPVTESNPKGDRAKRQNSFCARMCGMKRVNTGGKTKKDPDSRINKSLRKWNCKCGSDMTKEALVPGLMGAFAGAAGGGLTGKKDKVNRAIGRGAAIGAATELGMYPGFVLGGLPGLYLGNLIGGPTGMMYGGAIGAGLGTGIGGILGNSAAQGLLGPYETPEEREEEKDKEKKMAAYDFRAVLRKLAAVTMCDAPKHNDDSGVDVNPAAAGTPEGKEKLTKKKKPVKAEDVVGKKANSHVSFVERKPKDLTRGNLNPRAAGEDHEEPEQEDTDSEAYEFGKKVAQSAIDPVRAQQDSQRAINELMGPREYRGLTPLGNAVFDSVGPAARTVGGALRIPGANIAGLGLDAMSLGTHGVELYERLIEHPGIARRIAADHNAEFPNNPVKIPARKIKSQTPAPKVNIKSDAKPTAAAPAPAASPAASSSWLPQTPMGWAGAGLGATGLAGLAYYLSQRPKKKKREEEDDGLAV